MEFLQVLVDIQFLVFLSTILQPFCDLIYVGSLLLNFGIQVINHPLLLVALVKLLQLVRLGLLGLEVETVSDCEQIRSQVDISRHQQLEFRLVTGAQTLNVSRGCGRIRKNFCLVNILYQ